MADKTTPLLPQGLSDLMPDAAVREATAITRMMRVLHLFGYSPVVPPLVEFEETLLVNGLGAALGADTFRMVDPQSSRMLALRADMTAQIARIASTRMAHYPRPLRVSYNGVVLRTRAEALNPERQLTQLGAEMIGTANEIHDAELVFVALTALKDAGVEQITIDFGVPRLLYELFGDGALPEGLAEAVAAKNHALINKKAPAESALISSLLDIPVKGTAALGDTIAALKSTLPKAAYDMLVGLLEVVKLVQAAAPDVTVTVDPLEQRGFDYHHGIGFAIFAAGVRGELGRGGRYRTTSAQTKEISQEISTGVTIYLERVLRALPPLPQTERLYIPASQGLDMLARIVGEGTAAIFGNVDASTPAKQEAEAKALGCSHRLEGGKRVAVDEK